MKLKKLTLKNFRGFVDTEVEFGAKSTVIIGGNGSGKTSILDSIAICMTHFTGKLFSSAEGYNIDAWFTALDITNGKKEGSCSITLQEKYCNNGDDFSIQVSKIRSESGLQFDRTPNNCLQSLKDKLRDDEVEGLPVVAYFNVHRTYQDKIENKAKSTYNNLLFTYEKSLALRSPSFKSFEKWFFNQVIEENALKVKMKDFDIELSSLKYVRTAINNFLSEIHPTIYGSISIKLESSTMPDFEAVSTQYISIDKNEEQFMLNQLSDGERMIITLVAEIARRLVLANKSNPLSGNGVVLIDEVELHLHPNWQRNIIRALETTFPNITFIVTTHSPLVLSAMRRDAIKIIKDFKEIPSHELPDIYTGTADEVLNKLMFSEENYNPFDSELKEIDLLFNDMKFDEAYDKLQKIKKQLDSSPAWLADYQERLDFARR